MSTTGIVRSRQGCWSCRGRKIRCDQSRPRCRTCIKHDRACEYGLRLRWEEDSVEQGLSHGRQKSCSYPSNRSGNALSSRRYQSLVPTSDHFYFLNFTSADIRQGLLQREIDVNEEGPVGDDVKSLESACPARSGYRQSQDKNGLSLQLTVFAGRRGEHDSNLLSYFEAVICASSTFLDDDSNPYRWVLFPMALQSRGLYHAALAISANTLRLASPHYALLALEHQRAALQHLIRLLSFEDSESMVSDEILGLILMLCWFDISDGCRPSWLKHLAGFRALLSQWNPTTTVGVSHRQRLEQFCTQYFMFHLVLAKTTFHATETISTSVQTFEDGPSSRHCPTSSPAASTGICLGSRPSMRSISPSTLFLSSYLSFDKLNEIDLYMGFSNSLLLLLNEIAELTNRHSDYSEPRERTEEAHRLKRSLGELEQLVPNLGNIEGIEVKRLLIAATAETYRIGALLFLHEVVDGFSLNYEAATATFTQAERDQYIGSILDLVASNCHAMSGLAVIPLWPLFIAGCCADDDSQRISTMDLFDRLERQQRFGNITPAYRVVQATWKQRDLKQPAPSGLNDKRRKLVNIRKEAREHGDSTQFRSMRTSQYEWERTLNMLGGLRISLT